MAHASEFVEFDVELNKADAEWLDQEATRLGRTRNDLLCRAVETYLDRMCNLFKEREKKRQKKGGASRTGHGANDSPTAD